ncbi:MAG: hypothetical protein ACI30I_08020 [Parabacteroides sp.]
MNEQEIDKLIQQAVDKEMELPEGLSDRLERYVDHLPQETKQVKLPRKPSTRLVRWMRIAAAVVVSVIFYYIPIGEKEPVDTFSDPQEAALYAQQQLIWVSQTLNKGLQQMEAVQQDIQAVNQIVHKQLK